MGFESSFEDLMTQTITVEPWTEQDGFGEAYYGNPYHARCRVVAVPTVLRLDASREAVSAAKIYVAGAYGIDEKDRVTLPDGTTPPILHIRRFPDEEGDHHEVLFV